MCDPKTLIFPSVTFLTCTSSRSVSNVGCLMYQDPNSLVNQHTSILTDWKGRARSISRQDSLHETPNYASQLLLKESKNLNGTFCHASLWFVARFQAHGQLIKPADGRCLLSSDNIRSRLYKGSPSRSVGWRLRSILNFGLSTCNLLLRYILLPS